MSTITVIPDLHGSNKWKDIVAKETSSDLIIFLGDYVDSHKYTSKNQLLNLEEVLKFKDEHADQVILLLGNHDIHYMPWIIKPYSGYQLRMASIFRKLYTEAIDKKRVQMCYQKDHLLFTHAGVTKTWCKNFQIDQSHPEDQINQLLYEQPEALGFIHGNGYSNPIGDDVFQSPAWVRPDSLMSDGIQGFWQIVGHTVQKEITIIEADAEKYFFCDTFLGKDQYLKFTSDGFKVNSF